jgi:thiol:disulfide interchange protein
MLNRIKLHLMKFLKISFLLFFCLAINAVTVDTGHANVSLVKFENVDEGQSQTLIGIRMDMQENWHTYWKNPGDSGGPIKVKWSHDDNISISELYWPTPILIPYEPLMTYGYKNFVIFPFEINNSNDKNSYIEANIDFLICDDICVPEKASIKINLDDIKNDASLYDWFLKAPSQILPVRASHDSGFINIRFSWPIDVTSAIFFIDKQDIVEHAADQKLIKEENNYLLKIKKLDDHKSFEYLSGVLSVNDDESFIIDAEIENATKNSFNISFLQALIFAFMGGLILNLMPCVFPIISLKVLSFVSMSNQSPSKIRAHALSFCAGVMISFLLIGFAMILLKQAGLYLGWGFQLQSPLIVGLLSLLMFVIGLVLLSDINIGSSLTRLGSIGTSGSLLGSFSTGILAVIVASPCTAPFMGAALGYALIQPSGITLPVFSALGLGFAFPYFVLSASPSLINYLPKPGNWMVALKEFFAFPMFATSIWLIWVFSVQTSSNEVIFLLMTILMISLLIWIATKLNKSSYRFVIFVIAAFVIFFQFRDIPSNEIQSTNALKPESYDYVQWNKNIENEYKEKNQAYLINFTAAWCITCQTNDKIALSRPNVKEYIYENNIQYIVADWTNKNDEILKTLESYNRNGVPLYIFWKPGMSESKILPAILTEQILLESFNNS